MPPSTIEPQTETTPTQTPPTPSSPPQPGSFISQGSAMPMPPVQQPPISPPTVSIEPEKKPYLKILLAVIVIVVLIAGGYVAYTYHQKSVATKKVNDLAASLWAQEESNAKTYFDLSNKVDAFGTDLAQTLNSSNAAASSSASTAASDLKALKDKVTAICSSTSKEITADQIKSETKGLKLSAPQTKFISDWQDITSKLAATTYSSGQACTGGKLLSAYADNWSALMPALAVLGQVTNSPTNSQLATLKDAQNIQIQHLDEMQSKLPANLKLLKDMKSLFGDIYDAFTSSDPNQVLAKINADTATTDKDLKPAQDEGNALDAMENTSVSAASQAEINAINYQQAQGKGGVLAPFDATLPATRIVDAELSSYSDKHNNAYPNASDIDGLASIIPTIKGLKDKGLTKSMTYAGQGNDQSGFSFSSMLKDGTKLQEKATPTNEQS